MISLPSLTSGFGQFHTNEPGKTDRRPYVGIDLAGIRALLDNPQKVDKAQAQWLIPSTLTSRTFEAQEAHGAFWLLWADIDKDPPCLDILHSTVHFDLLSECDHEIYASSSAREEYQKSRILIPLDKPLAGADWILCQQVLNDKLEAAGIIPDRKSEGAAQLCYLPNRGEYYDTRSSRDGGFFDPVASWSTEIAEKRQQKARAAADKERRQVEAKAKREARSHLNEDSPISAFNAAFPVGDILIQAGYDQDGNRDCYRHPNSESGSYSASVKDGRVHSLSSNDQLYTGGSGGGAHDAFSAFTVLFHHGDQSRAIKDAGDNWLTISGESWNRVKQREFQMQRAKAEVSDFISAMTEDAKPHPLTALVSLEPINQEELRKARLTPRCVLPDLLYADVRTRISAGGTGKTTVALYEAVTLALGHALWGRLPTHPCKTVIVTREDSREILVARMREIMDALLLDDAEIALVLANVLIVDVSDRIPEIRQSWALGPDRKTFAAELKGVSYDQKNVKEGFAEFVRLYMTQPEQARSKAPYFSQWFDAFTERHEYGKAIKQAQIDMTAWFGQNAVDRARSKIGLRRDFNEAFDGFWDKFRQATVDDLHGVYRMERDLKGGILPGGAYETTRLSRASHSIAEGAINFGHPVKKADGSFTYQGKGLRQILEPLGNNIDDALLYFVGRSAQELKMQGREHLFTPAEISAMLELGTPETKKAFADHVLKDIPDIVRATRQGLDA